MVILVAGGRDYNNYDRVREVLDEVCGWTRGDVKVINGGCRGADQLATQWAKERGFKYVEVHAEWNGPSAGPIRNQRMIDEFRPDTAVVFPGGKGTLDTLTRLFHAGVPTRVVGK